MSRVGCGIAGARRLGVEIEREQVESKLKLVYNFHVSCTVSMHGQSRNGRYCILKKSGLSSRSFRHRAKSIKWASPPTSLRFVSIYRGRNTTAKNIKSWFLPWYSCYGRSDWVLTDRRLLVHEILRFVRGDERALFKKPRFVQDAVTEDISENGIQKTKVTTYCRHQGAKSWCAHSNTSRTLWTPMIWRS
jgi:hypothetical protein